MPTTDEIRSFRDRLESLRDAGKRYFARADPRKVEERYLPHSWVIDREDIQSEAEDLRGTIKSLAVDVAGAARGSPLIEQADLQDLRHCMRQMLANVRFNRYLHSGTNVHQDEGVVLGVDPPSNEEYAVDEPAQARAHFQGAIAKIGDLIDFLSPAEMIELTPRATSSYRPNTAFIMMPIDPGQPEYEDVKHAIKEVFEEFGIVAETADEKEHEGAITDRILEEISSSEFLIADLTGGRPNVYYEIGHAHALNKRVILYRREGTKLHFDLQHRNCPEFKNITHLKEQLRTRLEAVTNRPRDS